MKIQVRNDGVWFGSGNVAEYKFLDGVYFCKTFGGRYYRLAAGFGLGAKDAECSRISKEQYDAVDTWVSVPAWD